jgi:RNA-directed DNA polymerase
VYKAIQVGDKPESEVPSKANSEISAARMLAIRQVTQLNAGKKTAGIDGKASLTFEERFALSEELRAKSNNWKHQKLRSIPIPKKDGSTRLLKIPTIADRAWQCLAKYAKRASARSNVSRSELRVQNRSAIRWVETSPEMGRGLPASNIRTLTI